MKRFILLVVGLVLLSACVKEKPEEQTPTGDQEFALLIYMAGDNSMAKEIEYSLQSIQKGARWGQGDVVVYLDRPNAIPQLIKITQKGEQEQIKSYEEEDSGLVSSLTQALKDTQALYPKKKYGLVIWSHGDGWLPWLRSTAMDSSSGSAINIDELADALPDGGLEYIWFDACFMGSIEVFYQLRGKARYLVGSPTEVVMAGAWDASGAPYHKMLPYLFGGGESLKKACAQFLQHYQEKPAGSTLQSASIVLVETAGLGRLHEAAARALGGKQGQLEGLDRSKVQAYHRQDYSMKYYYDLGDVVRNLGGSDAGWLSAMEGCVLFKGATPRFTQSTKVGEESYVEIDPKRFSGISCYLPLASEAESNHYRYYFAELNWSSVWR